VTRPEYTAPDAHLLLTLTQLAPQQLAWLHEWLNKGCFRDLQRLDLQELRLQNASAGRAEHAASTSEGEVLPRPGSAPASGARRPLRAGQLAAVCRPAALPAA